MVIAIIVTVVLVMIICIMMITTHYDNLPATAGRCLRRGSASPRAKNLAPEGLTQAYVSCLTCKAWVSPEQVGYPQQLTTILRAPAARSHVCSTRRMRSGRRWRRRSRRRWAPLPPFALCTIAVLLSLAFVFVYVFVFVVSLSS